MLRLSRSGIDHQISVSLRSHQGMFNLPFLKALSIAILLHFLGLVVFKIQPFAIREARNLFPPVQVNTDLGVLPFGVTANIENESSNVSFPQEPLHSMPLKPKHHSSSIKEHKTIGYPSVQFFTDKIFASIENGIVNDTYFRGRAWEQNPVKVPLVRVSGEIAERVIPNSSLERMEKSEDLAVIFDVKVDNHTGKIAWYEPKGRDYPEEVISKAVKILKELRFTQIEGGFLSDGIVEINKSVRRES